MSLDPKTAQKKINRLRRKVAVLESMIENRSREAYYEELRRSIINALLEASLTESNIDSFLIKALELLFSMETIRIERKGAIFLLSNDQKDLVLHAQVNLEPDQIIRNIPLQESPFLSIEALQQETLFHPFQSPSALHHHQPDTPPHGHYYVPIKSSTRLYGVIILFIDQNLPRSTDDIEFFTSIADICAGGLERMFYGRQLLESRQNLAQQVEAQTIELASEKERLAVTLRSIGDGVISTDTSGNVVLLNMVAEQLTGWTTESAAGKPLAEIFRILDAQNGKPCDSPEQSTLLTGETTTFGQHTLLCTKDGKKRHIHHSCAPIWDKGHKVIGTVLAFRDISEQLKTEQELLKIKKLESVGVLAGGIAHDFNNILSAILGNLNLTMVDPNLNDESKMRISDAEKAVIRAKGLTQQLLTFAKGGEPVKTTASIGDVIEESAKFILHGANVACRFSIPDDLWLAEIDKGQISQVIQNIVLNASHASPDGGIIQISCRNVETATDEGKMLPGDDRYIKIEISDQGVGIPAETLERIFDPYFSTKPKGSGLGLTITHSIVTQHGGRVTVSSEPGAGSTFTIYLPASGKKEPSDSGPQTTAARKGGARILIMDDEEMVRNVVKEMLTLLGHDVLLAADGSEAIQMYRNATPKIDLLIMDLTIPGGMGGKETIQEILAIDPAARAIVSSGYSSDPVMANFQDYGFRTAIVKPFEMQELEDAISRVLA